MHNKTISAVEIVRHYGLSYQTVNYYTNLGLLKVIESRGNKRLYHKIGVEETLKKIRHLKSRGYPLRLIRDELLKQS